MKRGPFAFQDGRHLNFCTKFWFYSRVRIIFHVSIIIMLL